MLDNQPPLQERIEEFGTTLQALQRHYRRVSALTTSSEKLRAKGLPVDELEDELEGEAHLIEYLTCSIGERHLAIAPPEGMFPKKTKCLFSDVERKTAPEHRRLAAKYDELRTAVAEVLERRYFLMHQKGQGGEEGVPPPPQASPTGALRGKEGSPGEKKVSAPKPSSEGETAKERRSNAPPKKGKVAQSRAPTTQQQAPREEGEDEGEGGAATQTDLELLQPHTSTSVDVYLQREKERQMREIAEDVEEVKRMKEEMHSLLGTQGEGLEQMESNADATANEIERGRDQLLRASRMKVAGAWISGAILGGLIAGPAGALAGAKTAGAIVGCTAAGSVAGGVVGQTMSGSVHRHNADFEDPDRRRSPPPPPSSS